MTPDEYVEAVLELVDRIPPGRVMSYGAVADALAERSGRASARLVGSIMARHGAAVGWHRVVNASGAMPARIAAEARARWLAEGTPLRQDRVDMRAAGWRPGEGV
ncbi:MULTISPECIES: MGMT family protein [Micromonospora]|uniref:Cysteine methyltransferase n=1 Tax=Micromonospora maris TaxID=1003110 RepID=A0A9X0I4B6_9ACTN|nr:MULTISPECIES: MGMT family protein [Micromonospora]AEB47362.1 methylated-DNA-(protein)-cysteine S-methyltransferase DNA binding protein [Micromonospora maris AB-18-032]KUJ46447.1 cysteine methyltransferase [Micromonospora maris]RUL93733.1 cysteine methyltransferase [Verrucosispora sp. FIM060022]